MSNTTSFEKSFARLEEITDMMEGESLPLDEALKLFEEGMKLVEQCNARLKDAEQKVSKLTRSGDELAEEEWSPEE